MPTRHTFTESTNRKLTISINLNNNNYVWSKSFIRNCCILLSITCSIDALEYRSIILWYNNCKVFYNYVYNFSNSTDKGSCYNKDKLWKINMSRSYLMRFSMMRKSDMIMMMWRMNIWSIFGIRKFVCCSFRLKRRRIIMSRSDCSPTYIISPSSFSSITIIIINDA